jgi:hypothetical protein
MSINDEEVNVKVQRVSALVIAVLAILAFTAAPAQAHDVGETGPFACGPASIQSCGTSWALSSHTLVRSCDQRSDGYGFYTEYRLAGGQTGTVGDGNGAASGCGDRTVGSSSNPVVWIRPCSDRGSYSICWQFGIST